MLILALVAGIISQGQSPESKLEIQKLISAMQLIDLAYVDSVKMNDIVAETIVKTLKDLDPHSSYISKEDVEKVNEPLEGSFEGIGVTFQLFNDTILVVAPIPGGPSEKLGIMAGDKIVAINGENATGEDIDNQWVMDRLRGKKGTTVDVTIYRKGRKGLIDYVIERDKIPLNSIDATFMANANIGYIRLNRFSRSSVDEFRESVTSLRDQGMEKLILDLRGNTGGYLGTAIELADEFLPFDKLIVYTEGTHSPRQDFNATPLGSFEKGKLVILIDESSASASEIVAGAVQDWDRGLVLGRRSFGKGLVQRPFNLPDGSVIRLTTARYYTPSGRCIQRPYEDGKEEYYMDFYNRYKHGELVHADSIKFPDSLRYETANGRAVYGGGGIMPDMFIPWDSSGYSDYYADIRRKGLLNQFTVQYVDDHRKDLLERYPDVKAFRDLFVADESFIKEFTEMAEKEEVPMDEEGWKASGELIQFQLKALIARNLWDVNSFYFIMVDYDDTYSEAVKVLDKGLLFSQLIPE